MFQGIDWSTAAVPFQSYLVLLLLLRWMNSFLIVYLDIVAAAAVVAAVVVAAAGDAVIVLYTSEWQFAVGIRRIESHCILLS